MDLTHMPIGKRLSMAFGIAIFVVILLALVAWWGAGSLKHSADEFRRVADNLTGIQELGSEIDAIMLNLWNISTQKEMMRKQE